MVFTLHRRGLFLCLFTKRIFLVRTLCDHHLHKVFTRVWKSRQGQSMSVMELYDLTHMRINHPVFDPLRAVMLSSRAHCPRLSCCPRTCPAVHAPRQRPAPRPASTRCRPAPPAPRAPVSVYTRPRRRPTLSCCPTLSRCPTLSCCPASYTPRPPQNAL